MTPLRQQGYDDQKAGRIDAELFCADTNEARDYREGARVARRELAAGIEVPIDTVVAPNVLITGPSAGIEVPPGATIGVALEDSTPAPDGKGHLVRVKIDPAHTPGAFADPPPRKKRAKIQPDDGNLNLF